MKLFSKHLLVFTVLLMSVCNIIQARPDSESTPSQRLRITVADNRSVYTTVGECNNYENLLRLKQPDGQYKLTAGMLNEGENHIVFHRIDDSGVDSTFARLNLYAEFDYPQTRYIGSINFYGSTAPSSDQTLTTSQLPDNWSTDGSGLVWQSSGYGTITTSSGLSFTVPAGYTQCHPSRYCRKFPSSKIPSVHRPCEPPLQGADLRTNK